MKLKRESCNQFQKLLFLAWKAVPTAVPETEQPQGTVEEIKVKNKLKKRKNKKNTKKSAWRNYASKKF
jgi:hypothetical protein